MDLNNKIALMRKTSFRREEMFNTQVGTYVVTL